MAGGNSMSDKQQNLQLDIKRFKPTSKKLSKDKHVIVHISMVDYDSLLQMVSRPFDNCLTQAMRNTLKDVCEAVPNCMIGYAQSGEIDLVCDAEAITNTASWHKNDSNKLVSTASSLVTAKFIGNFREAVGSIPDIMRQSKYISIGDKFIFETEIYQPETADIADYMRYQIKKAKMNFGKQLAYSKIEHGEHFENLEEKIREFSEITSKDKKDIDGKKATSYQIYNTSGVLCMYQNASRTVETSASGYNVTIRRSDWVIKRLDPRLVDMSKIIEDVMELKVR